MFEYCRYVRYVSVYFEIFEIIEMFSHTKVQHPNMQEKSNTEQFTPTRRVIKKKGPGPGDPPLGPRPWVPETLGPLGHLTIDLDFQGD